jgi:hypothetical protein
MGSRIEMEARRLSLVIAIPNDAVADADAGDAMSGAVREDDA